MAFPPINWSWCALLVPAPLTWLALRARGTVGAVLLAMFVQWLMWLWLMRWIIPVTAVGYPVLALYMSIYGGLYVWVIRRLARHPRLQTWPMTLLVPVAWTGLEFLRGDLAFDGYPWYLLAHPLVEWPMFAQSADLFGAYWTSFLAASVSGLIIDVIRSLRALRGNEESVANWKPAAAIVACAFAANLGYGVWRLKQSNVVTSGPRILAIQTNLPQDNKIGWSPQQQEIDIPQFIDLTRRAVAAVGGIERIDLIVWPETMVPGLGFEASTMADVALFGAKFAHLSKWAQAVIDLSRELRTPILAGSNAWIGTSIDLEDGGKAVLKKAREYNSAFLIQDEPPLQRYDKYFLTPFGETMPYISQWPWLERQLLSLGAPGMSFGLDANPDIRLLTLVLSPKVSVPQSSVANRQSSIQLATPICFEDTVSALCRRMAYENGAKRTDVFVNLSNDGWFGESDGDRRLQAMSARYRCIENRVPMVRCVNTGVSLAIDSSGRVVGAAGAGEYGVARQPGWLLAEARLDERRTLFGRIGNLFAWLSLAVMFGLLMLGWWPARGKGATV